MRKSIYMFLSVFSILLGFPTNPLIAHSHHRSSSSSHDRLSADYVVVGVGTAGATMAKKLSNDKKTSVIALQNGENQTEDPLIKFSEFALLTVADGLIGPPYYINGEGVPQVDCSNRELLWTMAHTLGGASTINAGAWCRATDQLNAQWEAIAGPLWSVNRITRIYKELEHYHGQTNDPNARGYHGPLSIRQVQDPSGVSQTFTTAIINATGVPFVLDYNDPLTPIGASSQLQYTQSKGTGEFRVCSATAFLNEKVMTPEGFGVNGRKLRVLYNSTGLRTIWQGNRAVGVEFIQDGVKKTVLANKGVVVCAGLYSSPFLLHSGVGPANKLNNLNIPVVVNNPNVGKGLADQPRMTLLFSSNIADTPVPAPNGIFAQIAWLPAPGGDPTSRQLRFASINPTPGLTVVAFDLVQPTSRGTITINSSDPLDPPVVNQGFLDQADLNLFVNGFQTYIVNINTQLQLLDTDYELLFPDLATISDTAALEQFIKGEVASNMHFQSHCRMAPRDQGGVVNSRGKVYGTQNLYVADNSISPLDMDGSPMATGYLIAANIAELLLEQ